VHKELQLYFFVVVTTSLLFSDDFIGCQWDNFRLRLSGAA